MMETEQRAIEDVNDSIKLKIKIGYERLQEIGRQIAELGQQSDETLEMIEALERIEVTMKGSNDT